MVKLTQSILKTKQKQNPKRTKPPALYISFIYSFETRHIYASLTGLELTM